MLHTQPSIVIKEVAQVLKDQGFDGSLSALSRTNKTINEIVKPVLWKTCTFQEFEAFMKLEGSDELTYIRHLTVGDHSFGWDGDHPLDWTCIAKCTNLESLRINVGDETNHGYGISRLPPSTTIFPNLTCLLILDDKCHPPEFTMLGRSEAYHRDMSITFPALEKLRIMTTPEAIVSYYEEFLNSNGRLNGYSGVQDLFMTLVNGNGEHLAWEVISHLCPNVQDLTIRVLQTDYWPPHWSGEGSEGQLPRCSYLPYLRKLHIKYTSLDHLELDLDDTTQPQIEDMREFFPASQSLPAASLSPTDDTSLDRTRPDFVRLTENNVEDGMTAYASYFPCLISMLVEWTQCDDVTGENRQRVFSLVRNPQDTDEFFWLQSATLEEEDEAELDSEDEDESESKLGLEDSS